MRLIAFFLLINIAIIQYDIWTGKGGWKDFTSIEKELSQLEEKNKNLQIRNNAMRAEIDNLKRGKEAVIETARKDLGFIQKNEIYYQIIY